MRTIIALVITLGAGCATTNDGAATTQQDPGFTRRATAFRPQPPAPPPDPTLFVRQNDESPPSPVHGGMK